MFVCFALFSQEFLPILLRILIFLFLLKIILISFCLSQDAGLCLIEFLMILCCLLLMIRILLFFLFVILNLIVLLLRLILPGFSFLLDFLVLFAGLLCLLLYLGVFCLNLLLDFAVLLFFLGDLKGLDPAFFLFLLCQLLGELFSPLVFGLNLSWFLCLILLCLMRLATLKLHFLILLFPAVILFL